MFEKPIHVGSEGEKVEQNSTEKVPLEKPEKINNGGCGMGYIAGTLLMAILFILCLRFIKLDDVCNSLKCHNLSNIPSKQKIIHLNEGEKFERPCSKETDIIEMIKCISAQRQLRGTQTEQEQEYPDSREHDESDHPMPLTFRRGPKQQNETHLPNLLRIRREISNEMNESSIVGNIISPPDNNTDPYEYIDFHGSTSSSCKFPNGLNTAEILCKMWSKSITCKSYCVYGNTYSEGIVRTHFCKYKENKWSQKFEECKPFVDCKLKLVTPGNIKCVDDETMKSPTCRISCGTYENEDGTDNSKMYDCKSGTWDPPLPNCVAPKGTPLVKAPKVTVHADVLYP